MKKIIEIIVLTIIIIITLWLGAFLLRDKSEFFCKVSFGEYIGNPASNIQTGGSIKFNYTCTNLPIVNLFSK